MARNTSPADGLLKEVVKQAVTGVLKPAGFRKSGFNFHRRHGEVAQVVNLQMSRGCTWEEKLFYINVGLAFDSLCRLAEVEIIEKPKESECDGRGTRGRLENFIRFAPGQWQVTADSDPVPIARALRFFLRQLATELEGLDSVQAYRDHAWFDRWRAGTVRAQVYYVLGDLDDAQREIERRCQMFADRENAPSFDWFVETLHFPKLRGRAVAAAPPQASTASDSQRNPLFDASLIPFQSPGISLADAMAGLQSRGLTATRQGDALAVSWQDGLTLRVCRSEGEAIQTQSSWLGEGTGDPNLAQCDCRFEILIADLDQALDEMNTLIEVQATLQALTNGYRFNCWNGQLSPPSD